MENENSQNEYFLKKEAKEKEVLAKESKKKMKKFLVWAVILVVVGFGAWRVLVPIVNAPDNPDTPEVKGDFFPAQTRQHIAMDATHPDYNSNPPTGGWHYDSPARVGIYDKELADEQLLHNLEHGHVLIAYRPDLDAETIEKLADIAKSYGSKIVMVPRAKNDKPIALAAWEYLLRIDSFDKMQIEGFIKAHRGKGPENIPAMSEPSFKDFRQK
ncbi:MAG: DUF3105 domain-containing protein [Candidatus Yanofskybacteria bacterium]|nr:DUF3105 domain-containing protein [Candidatus Yanofskybacteria bacterium]